MKRRKFLKAAVVSLTAPTLLLATTKNNGVNDATATPYKMNLNMDMPELEPGDIGIIYGRTANLCCREKSIQ